MAFPLLPIIAAAAPAIIGGVLSSHAQKKQNRSNQKQAQHERAMALEDDATRFTRLRTSAQISGFNPLTALQYGGTTSGFGSGRVANQVFDWGPTASAAMTAALPELTGQAGIARTREQLEQDLLKVQTDALRTSTTATQNALSAASAFQPIGGTGAYTASSGSASSRSGSGATPTLMLNGVTLRGDPDSSIAEDAEAIAGEAGGLVFGVNQLGHMATNYLNDQPRGLDGVVGDYLAETFRIPEDSFLRSLGSGISSIANMSPNALGLQIREYLMTDNVTVRPQSRPWPDRVGHAFAPLW